MLRLGIALVVVAAVVLSCGRLAVKRKDDGDGKKSEPTEAQPSPTPTPTDEDALLREKVASVLIAFAPKSLPIPDTKASEVLAGTVVRETNGVVRLTSATTRFALESHHSEGWTAELLITGPDCAASLMRITKTLAVWQGKIMLREGCDSYNYTDFVGNDAMTTASSFRLGVDDDPKTATVPALEGNPYCARPGEAPVFGKACTSTVAAILVGAYGDPALWVSPKELGDLKTP